MDIILSQVGKEPYQFAVLPSTIEVVTSMQNTTVNISNLGEINMLGSSGLKTLSLSSFFPDQIYDFVQYEDFPKPQICIERIKSYMNNPVNVIITDLLNEYMTIESFTFSKQDGTKDIYFTIELKEYRNPKFVGVEPGTVNKNSNKILHSQTNRKSKKVDTTTYTVKSGDTLWTIAKRLTGDSSNYKAIAKQNHITNPDKIYVGQKLVIKV